MSRQLHHDWFSSWAAVARRRKRRQQPASLQFRRLRFEALEDRRLLATYVVNTTANAGAGSLRQAIDSANLNPGADNITFNIGTGLQTITPLSALPTITGPTSLDGTTQPGFAGSPLIQITGSSAGSGAVGLEVSASNSTIRGFVINQFNSRGVAISGSGNSVVGNYIGTNPTGAVAQGNGTGIFVTGSNNVIGGTSAADRNVVSGNSGNSSGETGVGVLISGSAATNNAVLGNYVGLNASGSAGIGNLGAGIRIQNGTSITNQVAGHNTIGGITAGMRNIVAGNTGDGIDITFTSDCTVQGNYVGTNAAGNVAIGNIIGIFANQSNNNLIGGTDPGAGNLVSGNQNNGISVRGDPTSLTAATGNIVQGNFVGTQAGGTGALGNAFSGINFSTLANNNSAGGTSLAARNIICSNGSHGVNLIGDGNLIQGNWIGIDASGNSAGNSVHCIDITGSNNTIGGSAPGAANRIANAVTTSVAGVGIRVTTGTGNRISRNSIFSNDSLGIDLISPAGPNPNDPQDQDVGGNLLQNYPIITSAITSAGITTIQGTLNSTPNADFTVELFRNQTGDSSGYGEGQTFIGDTVVTTNSAGDASFSVALSAVPKGEVITSTATDAAGNTSEFSLSLAFNTVTWTGLAGDNQWATPANWDGNKVPSASDDVVIDTAGTNITIHSNVTIKSLNSSASLVITKGAGGSATALTVGSFANQGLLTVPNGNSIDLRGNLTVSGSGIVVIGPTGVVNINGSLLGNTKSASLFSPQGTIQFNSGLGSANPPQLIEAMSADLGPVQSGFQNNFAFGSLSLSSNTFAKLVDQSDNFSGSGAEAVYANELVVPAGATLDLNGLHLFVRGSQIVGTIIGGSVTQLPSGGPITLGSPTQGTINPAGQITNWSFYGRAGHAVTVQLNPGSNGSPAAPPPQLGWGAAKLLDASGNVMASAASGSNGASVLLSGVSIPTDGTYTIQVQAAPGHTSSTGNYVLSAYDATPNLRSLTVNQQYTSSLPNQFAVDQWTFSSVAGQQVQLDVVNISNGGAAFDLTGPGSFTAFSNTQSDSALITLPSTGSYVLSVHGTNNSAGSYSFQLKQTSVVDLPLGSTYNGTLAGSGQAQLFKVSIPSAQSLFATLRDTKLSDVNEFYAKLGSPPTRGSYDYRFSSTAAADQQILVPSAAPGTWYFLVYGESVPTASSFNLQVLGAEIRLTGVTPDRSASGSSATLTLSGAGFDNTTSVALVGADNITTYAANTVAFDSFTQLTAQFNLTSVPQGLYSVRVARAGGLTDQIPAAFTVTAPGQAHLETKLILPSALGFHIASTFYVQYSNTGSVAMSAPLLVLESSQPENRPLLTLDPALRVSGFWTSAIPQGYANTVQILASGKVPGVLQPGESVKVPVYYAGMQQPWSFDATLKFDLRVFTSSNADPVDWSSLQTSLRPPDFSSTAWTAIYHALTSQLGNTWGSYVQALDNEGSYLARLGEGTTDVAQLWNFAAMLADGLSPVPVLTSATDLALTAPGLALDFSRTYENRIDSRDLSGPLGYGWRSNWQYSLAKSTDGTVTIIMPSGARRIFQPDSRNSSYFTQAGDHGSLRADTGGAFVLQETNGRVERFNSDGTLNYVQDTNGNRITAGYTSGRLTSLTHSSGQSLTLSYNAAGFIQAVTASDGLAVTYSYDAGGHLITVQGYDGRQTNYTYDASANTSVQHALTSVKFADGTHEYFSYNSSGQLSGTSRDGGADSLTYSYDAGKVTVTDASAAANQFYFDQRGLLVKAVDPLGNASFGAYDADFNLASAIGPSGLKQQFAYDSVGNLTSSTDPLGQTVHFTYTSQLNRLASLTDARGITTTYQYDSHGNLISTQYPDHSVESATFDAFGDPLSLTNRRGQAATYTYNAAGQIKTRTLADGTLTTFGYDGFGNLTTAKDSTGVTTLTYDAGNRLTKVTYPNSQFLSYSYNANGQRTRMVDQSGFTVNYTYDEVGRLKSLTDGSGASIIVYTYDARGQLVREDKGNGTYTTHQYNAAGNLLHLINFAPSGAVNSRFDYTYNALGQRTSMATIDGTWTYSYDSTGQLIHAVFASTNAAIPNQDLTYIYDAAGNRTQTVINGVTTNYTTNSLNEYTSTSDGTTYKYDADGNMISKTDASGTTTYGYDTLNRLVSVTTSSDSWIYQYDALGNRVATIHNGQVTSDLIDPTGLGNVVAEYTGSGSLINHYTYGFGLVNQVAPSGANYYEFDALGSTSKITGPSANIVNSYSYQPFGSILSQSQTASNPFLFVGQFGVSVEADGFYSMRARDYSASIGRFTSNDPIGLAGGDANLYRYAFNDPILLDDPAGTIIGGKGAIIFIGGTLIGTGLFNPNPNLPVKIPGTGQAQGIRPPKATPPAKDPGKDKGGQNGSPPSDPSTRDDPGDGGDTFPPWDNPWDPPNPPLPPGGGGGGGGSSGGAGSHDPNDKLGPAGFGPQAFVAADASLPYRIDFENDPKATAPAQQVVITDQLDSKFDLSTFQLTEIAFGDTELEIPIGSQHYQTTVTMTYNGETFDVLIDAGLNTDQRQVYAKFQSIDPLTSLPPDVLTGFLPPENGTGRGQGYVSYTIKPKSGLVTGTQIRNVAVVTFDYNQPIASDQVSEIDPTQGVDPSRQALVTLDAVTPASSVAPLPAMQTSLSFLVSWSGTDDAAGSGVAFYDVYVSDNGGSYSLFQKRTTQLSATFAGQGLHTYAFYSVATDNAGNAEAAPTIPDTTTTVPDLTPPHVTGTTVQGGLTERSYVDMLQINFSEQTNLAALIANGSITSAVTLTNLGVNADADADSVVPLSANQFHYEFDGATGLSRLTWSLDSFTTGTTSLNDGFYQFILNAALVTDVAGNPLDGDGNGSGGDNFALLFHRLQGDADGNMTVDTADMNLVSGALGRNPTSATWNANADLDRDGRVTVRDRLLVARATGNHIVPPTPRAHSLSTPSLPGDFNNYGTVDAGDYVLWRKNQRRVSQASYSPGDAIGDGAVDNSDYGVWRLNFGRTLSDPATQLEATSISVAFTAAAVTAVPSVQLSENTSSIAVGSGDIINGPSIAPVGLSLVHDEIFTALATALTDSANTSARLTARRQTIVRSNDSVVGRTLADRMRIDCALDHVADDSGLSEARLHDFDPKDHILIERSVDDAFGQNGLVGIDLETSAQSHIDFFSRRIKSRTRARAMENA